MRKLSLFFTIATLAAAASVTGAGATPPSGQLEYKDYARVHAAEHAPVNLQPGTDVSSSIITLGPGEDTGWREAAGLAVLAVSKGSMTVVRADGCGTKDYPAGQGAVLTSGSYLLRNGGNAPLEIVGMFLEMPKGAAALGAANTAGCSDVVSKAAPNLALSDLGRGTMVNADDIYGQTPASSFTIEPGKGLGVSRYTLGPGAASGWHTHYGPALGIMLKGELTYYDDHGHGCEKSAVYKVPHGYLAVPDAHHKHLAVNEGTGPAEVLALYFNMPDTYAGVPALGQQMDSIDFGPMPESCMRLR